jgi:hypothetical protein
VNAVTAVRHSEPQQGWDEYTAVCYRCGYESRPYVVERNAQRAADRHECPKDARW